MKLPAAVGRWWRRRKTLPLRQLPLIGAVVRTFQDRLTPRGRYLFLALGAFALLGVDTRAHDLYVLFSLAAGLYLTATVFALRPRPRVTLRCRTPERATAGRAARFTAELTTQNGDLSDLFLAWPPPREAPAPIAIAPPEAFVSTERGRAEVPFELTPSRRGRYVLAGARLRATDPLGLVTSASVTFDDPVLLVYPRFYTLDTFHIPLGRRYQPGGIPLSSNTGDSIEFVGTREYRAGDPVRNIHWRSWARRGEPVVKEYQEEYFCRIAIILDTFIDRGATKAETAAFEAAVSVVATIADYFSRSEYVVDILAAGPDLYEVSAGRSLAYLDNILDVLACLSPCYEPPFQSIGPHLFERLSQLTTVIAVLQDWDPRREEFLRRIHASGAAVRGLIVHDGPTTSDWGPAAAAIGDLEVVTPAQVEAAIAKGGRA